MYCFSHSDLSNPVIGLDVSNRLNRVGAPPLVLRDDRKWSGFRNVVFLENQTVDEVQKLSNLEWIFSKCYLP
jgi:hypothetical protein